MSELPQSSLPLEAAEFLAVVNNAAGVQLSVLCVHRCDVESSRVREGKEALATGGHASFHSLPPSFFQTHRRAVATVTVHAVSDCLSIIFPRLLLALCRSFAPLFHRENICIYLFFQFLRARSCSPRISVHSSASPSFTRGCSPTLHMLPVITAACRRSHQLSSSELFATLRRS